MIEFTAFKSIFDNRTHKRYSFENWDKFESALHHMSKVDGYKPKRGEKSKKRASPLISPALFKKNTTRANDNVTHWSQWAALDIDDYDGPFEDTIQQFRDYQFICYSSASSTKDHPKFRIVIRLTEDVPTKDIKHFWFALNTEFSNVGDPQTKDLSRMYYVPAIYPNAYNFFFTNKGKQIMTPRDIMDRHEFVDAPKDFLSKMPMEMQRAVLQHRKDSLNNTTIQWSSYKDCPFVNKQMLSEYSKIAYRDGTGRYTLFYKIMVNLAGSAIRQKYPITPMEMARLMREIDADFGGRYKKRPIETEASRALSYILRTSSVF